MRRKRIQILQKLGKLKQEKRTRDSVQQYKLVWDYDFAGNRKWQKRDDVLEVDYTYNNGNQLTSEYNYSTEDTTSYVYDNNGNLYSKAARGHNT